MTSHSLSPFRLDGRHALVTGGTQGIGAAIAIGLASSGANVTLVGLREDDSARQTVSLCREQGVRCELTIADLSRSPNNYLPALFENPAVRVDDIDLLVNNVGVFVDVPFLQMDIDRFNTTMNINVSAGYFLTQFLSRRWISSGQRGRVLFTGSINGLLAEPDHTAYDASKGAVAAMVRSLCVALAPHGIRVNSIAPGLIRTPLTSGVIDDPDYNAWMKHHTPNRSIPDAFACAGTAVYLLSDAAEHVHGQTVYVDGGLSVMQVPDHRLKK